MVNILVFLGFISNYYKDLDLGPSLFTLFDFYFTKKLALSRWWLKFFQYVLVV
jgi:hypothetical protein